MRYFPVVTVITAGVAASGGRVVMRKIICRRPPGTCSTRRAAYTNLLVYKKTPLDPSLPDTVPDVIADGGAITAKVVSLPFFDAERKLPRA